MTSPNPTTPDSELKLSDDFLREIGILCRGYNGHLNDQHLAGCAFVLVDEGVCNCDIELPKAKAALAALVARREAAAREEQIMQDFLSLIDLPENFTEKDLIEWRLDRLAALITEAKEEADQ